MEYLVTYLIIISIIGFSSMFIDKEKAEKHKWRIPENRLFVYALLGGGVGSWLGMYVFRHKTKHMKFVIGIPLITIVEAVVLYKLLYRI